MNHTITLPKAISEELNARCGRRDKARFIREAVEEKLNRSQALDFLREGEEEVIGRLKHRLDQTVESANVDEINTAMLACVETLNAMRENSKQLTDEANNLRTMCGAVIQATNNMMLETANRFELIEQVISELRNTITQLTGVQFDGSSDTEYQDFGASGNSEVHPWTSAPKRG